MSVRHMMRQRVENLFNMMIEDRDFPRENETVVYTVFIPVQGSVDEESIEVSEQEVDLEDRESVKRFLDRTTREALEGEVKGLKLHSYVFETGEALKLITDTEDSFEEVILHRIERMREEV